MLQPDGARRCSRRPSGYPCLLYADGERETPKPARSPLSTRNVLPVSTDTPCRAPRFPPLPANTLARPNALVHPIPDTSRVRRGTVRHRAAGAGPLRGRNQDALAGVPPAWPRSFRPPARRSTTARRGGTRKGSAGRRWRARRWRWSRGSASTSWSCPPRPAGASCAGWARRPVRWPWPGPGCGCSWPRGARRSCRGCSTGWSGAGSPWTSRRSGPAAG